MKKLYKGLTPKDKIQIILNLAAFAVLITSTGGKGSFWAFLSFSILCGINVIEGVLSKDKTAKWVWITKVITYAILTVKFAHNMGEPKAIYFWMIGISATALLISRHFIKKRAVAMWGANFANIFGAGMYALAVIHHPESYGLVDIIFWLFNLASYSYLVWEVYKDRKDPVNYIISVYAVIVCTIHIVLISLL
ncbi:hypothetical protein KA013_02490 [Patescibacteria group bacterium]|nr:hypothetical protein [Patescibacteria group bacterium]